MRNTVLCLLVSSALVADLGAQDLEPNLERGVRRAVEALALALVAKVPSPTGIALQPDRATPSVTLREVREQLLAHGYRVTGIESDQPGLLHLELRDSRQGPHRRLHLADRDSDLRIQVDYGSADWVDERDPGFLVVEGPLAPDRPGAIRAAWEKAGRQLLGDALPPQHRGDLPKASRLFLAEAESDSGVVLYRAHLGIEDPRRVARALARDRERALRRSVLAPVFRGIASVVFLGLLGLGYLLADLRTRGYAATPLRLLFGLLGLIGLAACWRIGS